MWGKIIIPMYRLWLHGLYGSRCPLSQKRQINLISLSSQREALLQSNTISHWLGANLESALVYVLLFMVIQTATAYKSAWIWTWLWMKLDYGWSCFDNADSTMSMNIMYILYWHRYNHTINSQTLQFQVLHQLQNWPSIAVLKPMPQ